LLTTSKTDQQKDFQSAGTDGYEVKKDFAGPRLVENAVKGLAEPALKNSVLMNGYFLVEAIEEALGIFDARRRIPQPSS